jgi:hypothetical protein
MLEPEKVSIQGIKLRLKHEKFIQIFRSPIFVRSSRLIVVIGAEARYLKLAAELIVSIAT